MPHDTIPHRFIAQAGSRPEAPAYHVRGPDGAWVATSWRAYVDEVSQVARALLALGFGAGDRVCILGFNRPEWVAFDVAAMMAGGVPAGIYTTCSPEEVQYIVAHAEAAIVLVEDADQFAKITAMRDQLPGVRHVITMRGTDVDDPLAMTWEAFTALGDPSHQAALDARLDALTPDGLATLIYTSGTTGPPKAVMLSHLNLAHTATVAAEVVQASASDRMVSYLPLSHIAEQMFSIHGPLTAGYAIFYATSMDTLLKDLQDAHPTIAFAVPRVWEKMHAKISAAVTGATGVKGFLLQWAMGVGRQVSDLRNHGKEPTGFLAFQYRFASNKVYPAVKRALGLDEARFGISGAAPISADILSFFSGLDIVIHEVYGQSEGSGPTSFNQPGRTRYGTVGPAIPGTEIRIAEDGEICVRGDNVFSGYFKDPEATAETLVVGWLHSGDLGEIDDEGFLRITGRKKEIIITAGGKNIAPKNIEAALKDLPLVSQAVVIGDRRRFLSALITLDTDAATSFAAQHRLADSKLQHSPEVIAEIQRGIDDVVNPKFARVEWIRAFTLLPRDFTVEDGELTPTLKIKRRVVDTHFASEIEAMYATDGA